MIRLLLLTAAFSFPCNSFADSSASDKAAPRSTPALIESSIPDHPPVWVAKDEAFTSKGYLRSDRFLSSQISHFEEAKTRSERYRADAIVKGRADGRIDPAWEGCTYVHWFPIMERMKSAHSLDQFMTESVAILSGRVVAKDPGFYIGSPASLMKISVTNVFRSPGDQIDVNEYVLMPYSSARFTVAGRTFCGFPEWGAPHLEIGDRVLLFSLFPAFDADRKLMTIDSNELVVERAGKIIYIPTGLQGSDRIRTLSEFERLVRRHPRIQISRENGHDPVG